MEPIFNVRQQSEIYIGPTSDILSGVLPGGRVVVVSAFMGYSRIFRTIGKR